MKLSVAMCTYNGAPYLREQLDSIAAQTRLPDELIVCDDRSDDGTREIFESFAADAPFPARLYVNERNLGSTENFGRAMALCGGDAIVLSDQDDFWRADKLQLTEAVLEKNPAVGCVFSDGEVVGENLAPLGSRLWQMIRFGEREQKLFERGSAFEVLLDHNVVTGATMAFRSGLRDLILPIPVGLVHDGVPVLHDGWAALLIAAVAEFAFIPEPLIKYRQHPRQQMGLRPSSGSGAALCGAGALASVSASARRGNSFEGEMRYLSALRYRLHSSGGPAARSRVSRGVEARLAHLSARAGMRGSRLGRLPKVAVELLTLNYHRYSNGVSSAVKDLLF